MDCSVEGIGASLAELGLGVARSPAGGLLMMLNSHVGRGRALYI